MKVLETLRRLEARAEWLEAIAKQAGLPARDLDDAVSPRSILPPGHISRDNHHPGAGGTLDRSHPTHRRCT